MADSHTRDRVHEAIAAAVREAAELLERSGGVDAETRLQLLVDGWGRGLAAGLEELAVTLDELRLHERPQPPREPEPELRVEAGEPPEPAQPEAGTEDELQARAAASRAETEALREEAQAGDNDEE